MTLQLCTQFLISKPFLHFYFNFFYKLNVLEFIKIIFEFDFFDFLGIFSDFINFGGLLIFCFGNFFKKFRLKFAAGVSKTSFYFLYLMGPLSDFNLFALPPDDKLHFHGKFLC